MSGMKADGVLYLAAEFIDTFKEINKQVSKGAIEVAKNNQIKLSVDEKGLLASIDKTLGGKRLSGFDLSGVVTSRLKQFSELDPNDTIGRKKTLDDLNFDLSLLSRVSRSAIKKNDLKNMSADDITSAIEEVRTLMFKDNSPFDDATKNPAELITEIFLKNASNIKADIRKQLLEEFGGDVSKYGVSEKEANERLGNIYDSLTRRAEKQNLDIEEVATEKDITKIQGFYTRLKSLGSTISGKSKILGDMLESMFDDEGNIYSVEEEASDIIAELGENIRAYTEREKNLYKRLTVSTRDKINPKFNFEDITDYDEEEPEPKNKDISQDKTKQKQENDELLGQAKELSQIEADTANTKKEQTQETEKQNKLLEQQKQIKKDNDEIDEQQMADFEAKMNKIARDKEIEDQKRIEEALYGEQSINDKKIITELNNAQKKWNQSKKKYAQAVEEEDSLSVEKGSIDEDIDYLNYLRILSHAKKNHPNDKRLDKFKTETGHATLEDINEEIETVEEQLEDSLNRIKERIKILNDRYSKHHEQESSEEVVSSKNKVSKDKNQQQKDNSESLQPKKEFNKDSIKGMEDLLDLMDELGINTQEQTNETVKNKDLTKQVAQEKEKTVKETEKEVQAQQQVTDELKKQKDLKQPSINTQKDNKESELQTIKEIKEETQQVAEQQQKVAEVKQETLQAAQEELKIEQQLSTETQTQEKSEEQKPTIKLVHKGKKLADVQKHGKSQAEIDAQIKAEKEKKKKKTPIAKSDLEEKQKAEAAAAADSEKAKAEEIENLNYIANLNKKLAEAETQQVEKEAQKIQLSSEQMQKLKQGIQDATESLKEYKEIDEQIVKLQSDKDAYIISPKTQDEMLQGGVLSSSPDMAEYIRSAYRLYKKTGNKADEDVLKEALRQYMLPVGQKNGEYTYRDDKYLYSKNGKEIKAYTKDKTYANYIKQAQDEEAAYEKAQRKLPTLLDQKKSGQQSFVEASANIQQLLQEVGLDAEKINEILAAINGNLTNEEAIWKVISSYIKEANVELENQQNISENVDLPLSESPAPISEKKKPISSTPPSTPSTPSTVNTKEVEQSEVNTTKEANKEANGFKFIAGSAEEAAAAKQKFVEANKDVLQSIVASMPKIEEEAKALEKVEDIKEENNKTPEDFIEDKTNIEEEKKQAEEIAKRRKEAQQQYENQFHAWGEDGQLSFLDKNDYDLQNEYLELQKQEAEQLAKQAEQNPLKVNIPIEGQISFTNEEDINKIANEVYENSFIVNKDGQYSLFRNVEAVSNWGQELKEDLQEASKTDFSNLKNQLSLKDWEIAIDKRDKGIEERFKKINNSKSFIQNKDLPNEFLKQYEDISTRNGEGYKATSNLRELKNLGDELANIKTKLKVSFDEAGNLKSFADPLEIQSLLERYDELTQKIQRLKSLIESPDSQEFKLLKDTKEAEVEVEKLTSTLEKAYAKLSSSEKITTDTEKLLNPFAEANIPMTESIEQMINSIGRTRDIHSELASSFDSEGKLIGDPKRVQDLITEYNNLSKVVDELKVKISSPTSKENIALNLAKDAEKAEKQLDDLKNKVDKFFITRKKDTVESTVQSAIRDYGAINENGELRPIESPFFNDNKDLIQQQQYVISLSKALDEYRIAVDNLKKTRESDNIKLDDLKEANKQVELLENKINELDKAIKKIGKGNTNATDNQINGLKTKIQNILDKNTTLSTDATDKLKGYLDILNSGASISKTAYDSMSADIKQFSVEQTKSLTIWDMMTMKMREGVAFLATKFSFYQIFNQFRQGIEVIHQFDDALTEMMKVSDETRKTLEDYQKTTFDTADAIGTSALQLQNSTADFMRLGMGTNVLCSAV